MVYDNNSYMGRSLLIRQQNARLINDDFNDRVESIKVSGSCPWIIYNSDNFLATSYILNPGNYPSPSSWGGFGNRISSARALPPPYTTAIALFQYDNYWGRMLVLYDSSKNLIPLDFNDKVNSFIINGGHWTLYADVDYTGRSVTYGPGQYTLSALRNAGGGNRISSVKKN